MSQIARQVAAARVTKCLSLSQMSLHSLPAEIFELTDLVRLDLGYNHLLSLPSEIGQLTNLQQLWLNNNPLSALPVELERCAKLRQLDLRQTRITALPRELGRVKGLVDVDIADIPLKDKLAAAHAAGGTTSLLRSLQSSDQRKQLKQQLEKKLADGLYREVADEPGARDRITLLVKQLFREFAGNVEEQRSLIRNCERLLPPNLADADATTVRATFVTLRRDNEKKRLMAEVELKLRALYFDRIAPTQVESLLHDVATVFETLEDVQFLLKHAKALFPADGVPADTRGVHRDMVALRTRLARERAEALQALHKALRKIYHDVDPHRVEALLEAVRTTLVPATSA